MRPGPEKQTARTGESGDGGCQHWFYTPHTASAPWGIWKLSWCQCNMKQPPPWTVECLPARRALACQAILAETWRLWEPSQTGDQGKHWPKAQIHQELFVRLQLSAATTEAKGFFFFLNLVIRLELQEVKQEYILLFDPGHATHLSP